MRILFIAREKLTANRAPAYQILHTLRGIWEAGGEVRFVTPWPVRLVRERCLALTGRDFPPGIGIVSLGPGPDLPVLARLWPSQAWSGIAARLQRYLRRIQQREPETVVYTRNRPVVAALAQTPCPPIVFEYHEPESVVQADRNGSAATANGVDVIRREEQAALGKAAALVTVSRAHDAEAQDRYGYSGRRWVIPNAADPTLFAVPDAERRPRPGQFLYIGSIQPWKGLDLLLQALARVPAARLTLCGGVPESRPWRQLEAEIAKLGITDRVRMIGTIPQSHLRPYLATAQAAVLPLNGQYSIAERYTCPLKLFEYLCAGLPVVATDLPSIRDIVAHEREALLFADRDVHCLARTLGRLIDDPALAERLGRNARQAATQCTWQRRGERIVELCQTILETAAAHAGGPSEPGVRNGVAVQRRVPA